MDHITKIENKLGYDRIREQVSELCTTTGALEKFAAERFTADAATVRQRLLLCDQTRQAMQMESGFPTGEYVDLAGIVAKIQIVGAFLEIPEILSVARALTIAADIKTFFAATEQGSYPDVKALCDPVDTYPAIRNHFDSVIDRHGEIKDSASPELYRIRKAIREKEGQANRRLQKILAEARASGLVDDDAAISVRDGRAVIPVSAANKRKLRGFVHDESASGRTVYIEPDEVVEINNELRELENDERREIIRILTELTDMLRPEAEGLAATGDFVTTMDMLRAKARFAAANRCAMPLVSDEGVLELRQARHPLLEQALGREGRQIVPLDLTLTADKRILVISGPNAGGKSVCLKTVGLLQLMFQSGLTVPLLENSQMPLFDRIFIDIGDDQSLENDLSTYSSHLLNMKEMLQGATDRSLVLIDEFGTGTEPVIGGAIAESILERLSQRKVYGVITTHYSNIKYFAGRADGIANGAMMFDVQNIQPLFRLEMGVPGSSFAVEIARKIGLPEEIIRSASEKAGPDHMNLERQLREIARDRRYWEQKRDRIRIADRRVEELEKKYADQLAAIKGQRADILKSARTEAELIVAEANRQIENTIRTIRESQADRDQIRVARKSVDDFRKSLDQGLELTPEQQEKIEQEMDRIRERQRRREEKKGEKAAKPAKATAEPGPPKVPVQGSKVRMEGQDMVGEVQSVKGKKAVVAFGQILTTVALDKLTVVSQSEYKKQTRQSRPMTINVSEDVSKRKLAFRHSVDVRGMRAAEALEVVRDFIDDAVMVGASKVTILHGKGTGALKEEIRRYLRTVDVVRSAEDEHVDMGGAGITVVTMDY